MKKLEPYTQQHIFHDRLKEGLSKVGISIAYSKRSNDKGFTAVTVNHFLRLPDPEYTTDGYEELCRNDLETQHVREVRDQIYALLPHKVGEVRLDTVSTWDGPGCYWQLESQIHVRPYESPVFEGKPETPPPELSKALGELLDKV